MVSHELREFTVRYRRSYDNGGEEWMEYGGREEVRKKACLAAQTSPESVCSCCVQYVTA